MDLAGKPARQATQDPSPLPEANSGAARPSTRANAFLTSASFQSPQYVAQSAWLDHAPFAFWLVETFRPRSFVELGTHNGYSYFAICQAVKASGLATRCTAIDTWRGDEHAGFYEEEAFQRVQQYNEMHYAPFSRLMRATFDEALPHFSDGSIDLLHIDGRHFYEDVKHDFESWRPKLSDRAIVLFHDIDVRERGFGVFRLWEDLRTQFPSFEFRHGHGLGVLAYGRDVPAEVIALTSAGREAQTGAEIRHAYDRLGAPFKIAYEASQIQKELETKLAIQRERVAELDTYARSLVEALDEQHLENAELKSHTAALESHTAALEDHAAELEMHAQNQAERIRGSEAQIDALLKSFSWRLTAPLRKIILVLRRTTSQTVRMVYRLTPLPHETKKQIAGVLFRAMPFLFQHTAAYQFWKNGAPRRSAPPEALSRRAALREVARPIETDVSIAVPFGYALAAPAAPRLAVICHLFHENLAPEFLRYLRNIPFPFDLFISTDSAAKRSTILKALEGWAHGAVDVRVLPNRGRDIAPKLVGFKDIHRSYEFVLHLHSKVSDHASVLANWRGFLLETLLGSPEIVNSIFDAFARAPGIGMIAAQHFEPMRQWINWGGDFKIAERYAKKMGLTLSDQTVLDFPSGSMFWARAAALKPLLDLNLSFDDFDPEQGQIDGTLAHAIERLYFYACERAGLRWLKIAHPPLFRHTSTITAIDRPDDLTRFIAAETLTLSGPNLPAPRAEHPSPIPAVPLLAARLQDKAMGYDLAVDPAAHVAIGIITYNSSADQLRRVVFSARTALARAGLQVHERILVLDNGASTQAVLKDVEGVAYLPSAGNVGFGAGHNRLMKESFARGADIYIAVNPDGMLHPDAVTALVQMTSAHGGRALIEALQFPQEHPKPYDPFTFETPWASGACLAISRLAYDRLGGFDDRFFMYCEDVDLSWRARANGIAVRTCPRALFLHHVGHRGADQRVRRMIFNSGILLARKWGGAAFEAWLTQELAAMGQQPPEAAVTPAPSEWQRIADFSHHFTFAPARWGG